LLDAHVEAVVKIRVVRFDHPTATRADQHLDGVQDRIAVAGLRP